MVVVLCYGVLHHAWLRVALRCVACAGYAGLRRVMYCMCCIALLYVSCVLYFNRFCGIILCLLRGVVSIVVVFILCHVDNLSFNLGGVIFT